MFVVPRPRMLVERVQFALWEQSAVGRRMIAEAEPEQLSKDNKTTNNPMLFIMEHICCLCGMKPPI